MRNGSLRWINVGRHLVSICHIDNAVHGMVLAAQKGVAGRIYWIADDEVMTLHDFVQAQLNVDGLVASQRSVPNWLAKLVARTVPPVLNAAGISRPSPFTPTIVRFLGQQVTIKTDLAKRELGFEPLVRWREGLAGLKPLAQLRR